tara:strand:+ start:12453 stop:13313 length:861 start_codon:yes stop_codon:yes gene_type:complete
MADKLWVGTDSGNEGDLNTAANWSPSGVPGASDDVYFRDSSQNVTAGFTSIATINSLNIDMTFTGTFSDFWEVTVANVDIGQNSGFATAAGSQKILLDVKTTASTINVHNSGNAATAGEAAVQIKGNNSGNVLNVKKGSVEVEPDATESGTFGTVNVSWVDNRDLDARVVVGSNVTLTTWKQTGGTNFVRTGATTVTNRGGHLTTEGSGAITTLNSDAGITVSNSTGTITTANVEGKLDCCQSMTARTITNLKLNPGGVFARDPSVVTITTWTDPDKAVVFTANAC